MAKVARAHGLLLLCYDNYFASAPKGGYCRDGGFSFFVFLSFFSPYFGRPSAHCASISTETCSFHIAQPNRGEYDCCGQREPCVVKQKHASHHHSNYPYSSFWDFARGISGYTDTCELFGSITEENLEDNSVEKAYVGQLLRFKSRGASIADQNLLHIRIGNINKSSKYHFKNYTEQELDAIGAAGETRIFRNTEKTDSYAQADWIIKVSRIHL